MDVLGNNREELLYAYHISDTMPSTLHALSYLILKMTM